MDYCNLSKNILVLCNASLFCWLDQRIGKTLRPEMAGGISALHRWTFDNYARNQLDYARDIDTHQSSVVCSCLASRNKPNSNFCHPLDRIIRWANIINLCGVPSYFRIYT